MVFEVRGDLTASYIPDWSQRERRLIGWLGRCCGVGCGTLDGMNSSRFTEVDRTAIVVSSLYGEPDEKHSSLARSPYDRLRAVELMRQIIYGYSQSTPRLQRVLEVTQRETGFWYWHRALLLATVDSRGVAA